MRAWSYLGGAVAIALLVACEGSTAVGTTAADGSGASTGTGGACGSGASAGSGGAGAAGAAALSDISGSYDLVFENVAVADVPADVDPYPTHLWSEGGHARLDIRATASGYEAVVTPRYLNPTPMSVEVTDTSLTLARKPTNDAVVFSIAPLSEGAPSPVEEWDSIVIPRATDGTLRGPISAEGHYVPGWPETPCCTLRSAGRVSADTTPPEPRVSRDEWPHGPPGLLLPWGTLFVDASEGVDDTLLAAQVRAPSFVSWSVIPPVADSVGWSGANHLRGVLTSWSALDAFHVQVDAGLQDRAGNVSAAIDATVEMVHLGPPRTEFGFDDGVAGIATWGPVKALGASDPLCDGTGCLQIGPLQGDLCADNGVALRLSVAADAKVRVRYRRFGKFDPMRNQLQSSRLNLGTAAPGSGLDVVEPGSSGGKTAKGIKYGDLEAEDAWSVAELAATANPAAEIGFQIWAACPDHTPESMIIIDSVRVE